MPNKDNEQLPDILRQLRSEADGYVAPSETYFSDLAARSISAGKRSATVRSTRWWFSAAASVLVLFLIGWWLMSPQPGGVDLTQKNGPLSSDELLAEIEADEIDAYVNDQIDDFTLELYAEAPLQE